MKKLFFFFIPLLLLAFEPIKPIPEHISYNKQKALLGKYLFFDPILSKNRKISCSSCHDFNHGGADPRPVSVGVGGKKGKVNSPTVYNAYFNFRQFWNGRARDLKDQANGPVHAPNEMAMDAKEIEKRLNNNPFYKKLFKKVYHTDHIKYWMVLDAIAEFEKALITPDSKFDLYLKGKAKLSPLEKKGYILFKQLGCITCHNGINIGGNSFQKIGAVKPYDKPAVGDRYEVTKRAFDRYRYKVPSLRNIALTAPYFHDGSVKTLDEAVEKMAYHNLGFKLSPEEKKAIVAFLKTLTGKKPKILEQ
ncbi:cytochrome-c peroxidase [Nitratiruptor sp. SB155-2]|uniref:cytochrome-c peroxidase n=1 Tax=Nitratiruptor sp. (strain SB155-2) TaxID=387092 RepID=UPI0001587370|nr:cytochrome c peroxidase [Nitratiruptor sp. SB155-2]BAF70744.1 cytochrome c peroxidase [Nitratiruptor sp. SB155-2]